MALVHVVILFGTNNTEVNELGMGEREVWRREVGSRLVLLSRVFYAARYVDICFGLSHQGCALVMRWRLGVSGR